MTPHSAQEASAGLRSNAAGRVKTIILIACAATLGAIVCWMMVARAGARGFMAPGTTAPGSPVLL